VGKGPDTAPPPAQSNGGSAHGQPPAGAQVVHEASPPSSNPWAVRAATSQQQDGPASSAPAPAPSAVATVVTGGFRPPQKPNPAPAQAAAHPARPPQQQPQDAQGGLGGQSLSDLAAGGGAQQDFGGIPDDLGAMWSQFGGLAGLGGTVGHPLGSDLGFGSSLFSMGIGGDSRGDTPAPNDGGAGGVAGWGALGGNAGAGGQAGPGQDATGGRAAANPMGWDGLGLGGFNDGGFGNMMHPPGDFGGGSETLGYSSNAGYGLGSQGGAPPGGAGTGFNGADQFPSTMGGGLPSIPWGQDQGTDAGAGAQLPSYLQGMAEESGAMGAYGQEAQYGVPEGLVAAPAQDLQFPNGTRLANVAVPQQAQAQNPALGPIGSPAMSPLGTSPAVAPHIMPNAGSPGAGVVAPFAPEVEDVAGDAGDDDEHKGSPGAGASAAKGSWAAVASANAAAWKDVAARSGSGTARSGPRVVSEGGKAPADRDVSEASSPGARGAAGAGNARVVTVATVTRDRTKGATRAIPAAATATRAAASTTVPATAAIAKPAAKVEVPATKTTPALTSTGPSKADGATLKMRGLPFRASTEEVVAFFKGFHVLPDSLHLGVDNLGRPSGEGWISFSSQDEAKKAYKERNRQFLGPRYIELTLLSP